MKFGFILVALLMLISINGYVLLKGWQAIPSFSGVRLYYLVSMILLFVVLMVSMIFGNAMSPGIAKAVSFVGFSYFIVFIYLLLSFLIVDLVRAANFFIHFLPILPL